MSQTENLPAFVYEAKVMWSMVDANRHLRHSAYADFAAQARVEVLDYFNLTADVFIEHNLGPVLFREELIYMREIRPSEQIKITTELSKSNADASRWSFRHTVYNQRGKFAATINIDGAWIDIKHRKLTTLPKEFSEKLNQIPKTTDYQLL